MTTTNNKANAEIKKNEYLKKQRRQVLEENVSLILNSTRIFQNSTLNVN